MKDASHITSAIKADVVALAASLGLSKARKSWVAAKITLMVETELALFSELVRPCIVGLFSGVERVEEMVPNT